MTDASDSKTPSIPAWQTTTSHDTSDTSSKASKDNGEAVPAPDRNAVLDQARLFLEDASVRDAPREKKVTFLEKKGLQNDEIQKLLDAPSSEPSSSARQDSDSSIPSSPASPSSAPTTTPSSSSTPQTQPASQPDREIPPIITYPEFLLRPTKPPPLITLERLTYSLYTFAGISALTYGASKYLVQPMLQSLTSSRHDLASTALHNLEQLNEKLQANVSHIPATSHSTLIKPRTHNKDNHNDETASDIETVDSDPTELFHRDVATQTSPRLIRSPSPSPSLPNSSNSSPSSPPTDKEDPTKTQTTHLTNLKTSLTSLLSPSPSQSESTLLHSTITDTQSYLDRLQFSLNSYNDYRFLYGSSTTIPTDNNKGMRAGGENNEDEAMRFRQEIRSLKGALLSVRSFPAGTKASTSTPAGGAGIPT